uniref:Transcription factor Sp2 n=1 Tax=Anthurium amnicola TaxID=1678845 RepID=A0A1D1ZEQ5_9ARAE
MYKESQNNFLSSELMHYTSTQDNASTTINPDYINNSDLDFNIYSQPSTLTNDYLENELYNSLTQIGQRAQLVNQQETQIDVTNYSEDITLNNHSNHIVENLHYTTQDQSDLTTTSPHGYSENNITTPLLEPFNGAYSVHSTPLLQGSNQLLYSPIINTSPAALSDFLFDDIGSTPTCSDFGTPYTTTVPLITPNTPYINTPYVTNSSPFSVASSTINTPFAFQTTSLLDTPIITGADPDLYDDNTRSSSNWFSLFGSPAIPTAADPVKTYKRPYEDNNNFYNHISQPFRKMDSISLNSLEVNKVELESPKSEASTPIPSDKTASLTESPTPAVENLTGSSVTDSVETKIIESIKKEVINTTDSTSNTSADNKLVPIRPRPQDEDDSGENESTRRSKRQRTMSVSEENEEDNEEESEKKYNCPECGRGFNRKFNMQTHRQTHDPNRVKPFACEHPNCGSRFTRKHDLKRHINGIHKGEKVHECTVCRKPFSRKDAWKRHIATCGKM